MANEIGYCASLTAVEDMDGIIPLAHFGYTFLDDGTLMGEPIMFMGNEYLGYVFGPAYRLIPEQFCGGNLAEDFITGILKNGAADEGKAVDLLSELTGEDIERNPAHFTYTDANTVHRDWMMPTMEKAEDVEGIKAEINDHRK